MEGEHPYYLRCETCGVVNGHFTERSAKDEASDHAHSKIRHDGENAVTVVTDHNGRELHRFHGAISGSPPRRCGKCGDVQRDAEAASCPSCGFVPEGNRA